MDIYKPLTRCAVTIDKCKDIRLGCSSRLFKLELEKQQYSLVTTFSKIMGYLKALGAFGGHSAFHFGSKGSMAFFHDNTICTDFLPRVGINRPQRTKKANQR